MKKTKKQRKQLPDLWSTLEALDRVRGGAAGVNPVGQVTPVMPGRGVGQVTPITPWRPIGEVTPA